MRNSDSTPSFAAGSASLPADPRPANSASTSTVPGHAAAQEEEEDKPLCEGSVCAVRRPTVQLGKVPKAFNPNDCGKRLRCDANGGLTVVYEGPNDDEKNACSVRTHVPVPSNAIALFYFEVTVDNAGMRGNIGVGLCGKSVKLEKMPGWEAGSYGYHGDDGMVFRQSGRTGHKYGPKYTTGDTVGCCWDMVDNTVFFTKNGEFLGKAFDSPKESLYPTVGMQTKGGRLTANFGDAPFEYDIETYARQQRERVLGNVKAREFPSDYRLLETTVLGYLIHSGYAETAAAFARDAGRIQALDAEKDAMLERQRVCKLVTRGDIDAALGVVALKFPGVLSEDDGGSDVSFLMHCQKFIEMIVCGATPEETAAYMKKTLYGYNKQLQYTATLEEVCSLLAYVDPKTSPNGHLTRQSRRDMVAAKLNAAILKSQGRATRSALEIIVMHTERVIEETLKGGNGPVALVRVQDMF